ncbi:MbtH family protein [Amycolatopsis sp. NBC_01488]|uniref:MbtH family protein n=1 Tax=Amycolatopsis sp. NBC_01488 TaxID=2903563 RepID=UPI003FA46A47
MNGEMQYRVVVNHEDQHSIWPQDRDNPPGWTDEGFRGSKDECLAHIAEVWTDITPRSVREALAHRQS